MSVEANILYVKFKPSLKCRTDKTLGCSNSNVAKEAKLDSHKCLH